MEAGAPEIDASYLRLAESEEVIITRHGSPLVCSSVSSPRMIGSITGWKTIRVFSLESLRAERVGSLRGGIPISFKRDRETGQVSIPGGPKRSRASRETRSPQFFYRICRGFPQNTLPRKRVRPS